MATVYKQHIGLLSPIIDYIRIEKVNALVASGRRVLDVGCGPSFMAPRLGKRCNYTGVDWNPDIVAENRRRFPDLRFECFDATQAWPFEGNSFDTVLIVGVLEHVTKRLEMLSEAARVMVNGGQFIATTPSRVGGVVHDVFSSIRLFSHHAAEDHKDFFNGAAMRQLAEQCHLIPERIEYFELGMNQLFVLRKP